MGPNQEAAMFHIQRYDHLWSNFIPELRSTVVISTSIPVSVLTTTSFTKASQGEVALMWHFVRHAIVHKTSTVLGRSRVTF